MSMDERMAAARTWQMTKLKGGYGAITWPKMAGGRGGSPMREIIYRQEEGNFNIPAGFFNVSLGMVIPSVMAHASNEIRAKHAMAALSGKELWCQLLSEPNAGSDLGMVRTKAERHTKDGVEGWLINGQKVWTTMAQFADYGLVLCRTNADVSKFKGLSTFYIDMKDPGVEVRPIRQASGEAEFNEVFLNDVFVPDAQRVAPASRVARGRARGGARCGAFRVRARHRARAPQAAPSPAPERPHHAAPPAPARAAPPAPRPAVAPAPTEPAAPQPAAPNKTLPFSASAL